MLFRLAARLGSRLGLSLLVGALAAAGEAGSGREIVVAGQVRGPDGPLPRAQVEIVLFKNLHEHGRWLLGGAAPSQAEAGALADEKGWFRLVAPASGMWRLTASASGYVPMEYPLTPLLDETDVASVELSRDRGLGVLLLDERGKPVAGAQILATPIQKRDAYTPRRSSWKPQAQIGFTGEDGQAHLAARAGDSLRIEARVPGFPPLALSASAPARLTLRLAGGSEQRLQVRDSRRRAAAGVVAWLEGFEMPLGSSDDDGRISLVLPRGKSLGIRLLAAGGEHADVRLAPEAKPAVISLGAALSVSGQVLDLPRRAPVAGALVWAGSEHGGFVRTDRAGSYALDLEGRPAKNLGVAAPGYFEERTPLAAGASRGPAVALRPKAVLAGSVVDGRGRPLADVEIVARYDPAAARRVSQTLRTSGGLSRSRSSGSFRIDRLVPGASYTLRFAKPGFAPQTVRETAPDAGSFPEPLRIVLAAGRVARGFIRDRKEQPIPGAIVELRPVPAGDAASRILQIREPDAALSSRSLTDTAGRFELRDLRSGRYDLAVRAGGFAASLIPGVEVPEGQGAADLGTVYLEGEALVSGRVQGTDGRPLQGAAVRVVPSDPIAEAALDAAAGEPDAVSDVSGRFQLQGQRSGARLKLAVELAGYASREITGVPAPTPEPLAIVLQPASRVAGRIVDQDDRPVADVPLVALAERLATIGGMVTARGRSFEARSREDGTFVLDGVEPGRLELTASAPGWQETVTDLQVRPGEDLEGVEVVLRKAATITGQARGPDGAPVVGAEIGREEPPRPGILLSIRAPLATTDGEGRYRIDGLAPGPLRLAAGHEALGRAHGSLDAQPGENTLDFHFEGGRALSGRVVEPSGSPVEGSRVWLRLRSGTPGVLPEAVTRADGSFRFEGLAAGSYLAEARKDGLGRTREPVPVEISESPVEDLVLEIARMGSLRGHILGLTPDELSQVRLSIGWGIPDAGEVSYDGSYLIPDLPPGTWRVVAEIPRTGRRAEGEVVLDPEIGEADLDLDFREGLRLSGAVRRNGLPFAGASVTLLGSTGSPAWSETDAEGRFALQGLAPGAYRLEISDYRTGLVQAREIDLQQDDEVLIDLVTVDLTGIVVNSLDRQPVPQAEVSLLSLDGGKGSPSDRRALAAWDGTFSFPELGVGTWRVLASKAGYKPVEQTIVATGNVSSYRIELILEVEHGSTADDLGER